MLKIWKYGWEVTGARKGSDHITKCVTRDWALHQVARAIVAEADYQEDYSGDDYEAISTLEGTCDPAQVTYGGRTYWIALMSV